MFWINFQLWSTKGREEIRENKQIEIVYGCSFFSLCGTEVHQTNKTLYESVVIKSTNHVLELLQHLT